MHFCKIFKNEHKMLVVLTIYLIFKRKIPSWKSGFKVYSHFAEELEIPSS